MRCWIALAIIAMAAVGRAENVIESASAGPVADPVKLTAADVQAVVDDVPAFPAITSTDAEAQRIARKLDAHVAQYLDGYPFKPFHNTIGISGFETLFGHPDRLYYGLAICLPYLTQPTADRARKLLAGLLDKSSPYAPQPLPRDGAPREAYDVPDNLRAAPPAAQSAFGVYAFWLYCHLAPDPAAARAHWPAVRQRMQPLLEKDYPFDIRRQDYVNDEAQMLNGNIAALIGFIRLARLNRDADAERQATARLAQLLELRINLDRVNPHILEKTRSASKSLHIAKLARYCDMVPELGSALRRHTDGLAAKRLEIFRAERNAWYLAFGERMIGGENYINPAHFSHALFNGAALVERLDAAQLMAFVDVPWCKGDFYFMEKCALALAASSQAAPTAP